MTTVTSSSSSQISQSVLDTMNGTSSTSTSTTESTQDRFLKLLVQQMKNQDPLNPMDNAQVTSQMAQLSTVEGISKMNTTMDNMISSLTTSQTYQASSLIDKTVLATGNTIPLTTGSSGYFAANLPSGADTVTVSIKNSSGTVVRELSFSNQKEGINDYTWDGKTTDGSDAATGNYTFELTAKSAGTSVTSTALNYAKVTSVSNSTSGIKLNLSNADSIATSDIQEIY